MNIKQQTQNVAAQGRYGDNMLLHVNPAEVQGLASIMPLTKNPQTGQPEAFLPFLAPLLGSAAGTALFTGLNPAVAGAIGSGLATTIQSGDLRQGMLAGLTGFGLGKAFSAAGVGEAGRAAADAASQTATTGAEVVADVAADSFGAGATGGMGTLTGTEVVGGAGIGGGMGATGGVGALTGAQGATPLPVDATGAVADATTGGIDAFVSQLYKPSSFLPVAMGEGTRGAIQAQEDFEKAMRDYELGKIKRQEELMAMYPEQIPMSSPYYYSKEGGEIPQYFFGKRVANTPEQQLENLNKIRETQNKEPLTSVSSLPGKARIRPPREDRDGLRFPPPPIDRLPPSPPPTGSFEAAMSGGLDAYYTPPKQLSGPVTAESVPVIDPMTGTAMLDEEGNPIPSGQFKPSANYRPGIDPEFNYLPGGNRTASSLTGLGNFLGQTGFDLGGINPYIAADYLRNPRIEQGLIDMMEPNNRFNEQRRDFGPMFDPLDIDMSNLYSQPYTPNITPMTDPMPPMRDDFMSIDRMGNDMRDIGMPEPMPSIIDTTPVLGAGGGPEFLRKGTGLGAGLETMSFMPPMMDTIVPPMNFPIQPEDMIPNPVQSVTTPQPIAQTPRPVQEPVEMTTVTRPNLLGEMQTVNIGNYNLPSGPVAPPTNIGMQIPDTPIGGISAVQNPFIQLPTPPMRDDFISIDRMDNFPFRMEEGKQIPDDAKGLQALAKTEKGKDAVRQMGFELQMGGMAPSPDEIQQLQMAVLGQIPNNDEVISMFIDKYGNEMFMMIREQILNPTGNAQTQGMIEGMGGGMDDQVLGMIGSQQPVAVSPGEYIIPADVVSGLGDGSSDAGAKELDGLLDRVRQERTNTTKQPKELNKGKVLPK